MRVMAQMAMVMNLDKCIGCHTCSVTCKQAWTNRVRHRVRLVQQRRDPARARATRARYEDQEKWQGGWDAQPARPAQAQGRRPVQEAAHDLLQPEAALDRRLLRAVDLRLRDAHRRARPGAHPGGAAEVADLGQEHEDRVVGQLGRRPRRLHRDRAPRPDAQEDRRQGEVRVRADLHVLPAAHLRALPQPVVRGVVPRRARSTSARRTASSWSTRTGAAAGGCASPAAPTRRSTSTTAPARPRSARSASRASRSACPTVCSETCVGPAALHRPDALRRRQGARGRVDRRTTTDLYEAQRDVFLDPDDPEVHRARPSGPASRATGSTPPSARRSTR